MYLRHTGEKNVDAENIQERDAAHAFPVKRRQTKFENKKKKKTGKNICAHTGHRRRIQTK